MGKIIGIDLGTTNSCVAVMEGGQPTVIANTEGARTTPSVVAFTKTGERLVGEPAKRQAVTNADRTISSIKREMGTDYRVTIDDKKYSPQEISAMILQKLKKDAEAYLGENEKEQKIMVYDLGGGTFDVSVIEIGDGVIEVLSTAGNNRLGGDDFDKKVTDYMLAEFKRTEGVDLSNDKMALQRLKEAAEKAKKELSSSQTVNVNLPFITVNADGPLHLDMDITRAKFDQLTSGLVQRTIDPMKKAMADAAYEIQKEEQRKTIEVTTANADIAKQEREIELKQKQVAVTEQSLEAEVKKKAEAEKYAAQQRAEAELYQRQKDAEAKQFEAQREAEAQKAQAEAMRFAREQEAAGIRAVGEAEASAIQAKGIAEAEAMEKKAEAYAKYNKAAVAEMMIKVLPDIAGKVAEPLGQIDKITIIGGGEGGSNGVDQIAGNVPVVMAKVFESMKEATGIDLADIINAESYDAKVNRNVNVSGLDSVNFVVKDDGTKVTMAKVEPQNSTKPVSTDVPESGERG